MGFWSGVNKIRDTLGSYGSDLGSALKYSGGNPISVLPSIAYTTYEDYFKSGDSVSLKDAGNNFGHSLNTMWRNFTGETDKERYQQERLDVAEQNAITRAREDSAYARALADMQSVGLNPLSASNPNPANTSQGQISSVGNPVSGFGDLLGLVSPVLSAIGTVSSNATSRYNANLQAETALQTARIAAAASGYSADTGAASARDVAKIHADTTKAVNEASLEAEKSLKAAQARAANASASDSEYETEYKKTRGYGSHTPDPVKTVKEVASSLDDVADSRDDSSPENINKAREFFKDVTGKDYSKARFASLYFAFLRSSSKSGESFKDYIARKYPRHYRAWIASRGN